MPAWSIQWTDQAIRDFAGLDKPVARRILKKIEAAAADPPRFFERLVGADDHKLRVGDYRILALLSYDTKTLILERVDHRSRVYDRKR
jgi:mRNA-degrading endonuclease RelE of RelBE toxin-antitoxin system